MSDPWPSRDTSPDEMNFLVQQEMFNLKALKRLSLGAQGTASQDPDLPDLELEAADGDASHIRGDNNSMAQGQHPFSRQRSFNRQYQPLNRQSSLTRKRSLTGQPSVRAQHQQHATEQPGEQVQPHIAYTQTPSASNSFHHSSHHSSDSSSSLSFDGKSKRDAYRSETLPLNYRPNEKYFSDSLLINSRPQPSDAPLNRNSTYHDAQDDLALSTNTNNESEPDKPELNPTNIDSMPEQSQDATAYDSVNVSHNNVNDLKNMWVPAAVHPELAPNEWQVFVDEKLAEIRNSQEAQHQSRIQRNHSRLSHVVAAPEEYVDASAILDEKRRSSGGNRRSILELSKEFTVHDPSPADSVKEDESLVQGVSLRRVASSKAQPTASPEPGTKFGATNLRRSTHRLHKPELKPRKASPDLSGTVVDSGNNLELSQRNSSRDLPDNDKAAVSRSVKNAETEIFPSDPARTTTTHSTRKEHTNLPDSKSQSPLHVRKALSISIPKATATTVEQPISPSMATPSQNASEMLGYRRRKRPQETYSPSEAEPGKNATNLLQADPAGASSFKSIDPTKDTVVSPLTPNSLHSTVAADISPSKPPYATGAAKMDSADSISSVLAEKELSPVHEIKPDPGVDEELQVEHVGGTPTAKTDSLDLGDQKFAVVKDYLPEFSGEKESRRWKWLDSNTKQGFKEGHKESKSSRRSREIHALDEARSLRESKELQSQDPSHEQKERRSSKEVRKPFANLFKKRDSKKEKEASAEGKKSSSNSHPSGSSVVGVPMPSTPIPGSPQTQTHKKQSPKKGYNVPASEHTVSRSKSSTRRQSTKPLHGSRRGHSRNQSRVNNDAFVQDTPEIKLPYEIPAHQVSDRAFVMMYHRFPLHIERAIYRLSHMKLGNPRRPLHEQVLLSNFMYAYLNLINYGYQQQQLAAMEEQKQWTGNASNGDFTYMGNLEESQLQQLHRIENKNYDADGMYATENDADSSSSSSEDEVEQNLS